MSIFADVAKGVVGGIATPFSDAWKASKDNQTEQLRVNKTAETQITIANWQADIDINKTRLLLNLADSTHWSTRWIRPAFCALAFVWVAAELFFWMVPKYKPVTELDFVVKGLLAGIVASLFLLRQLEKNKRVDVAANAVQSKPRIFSKVLKREDAQ